MNIAIPTKDGITVAPGFRQARGFLVCRIEFGKIVKQEIRWNLLSDMLTTEEGFYYNLTDCDVIIGKNISQPSLDKFAADSRKVILTDEELITNILIKYMDEELVHESNTTCCP